MAIDATNGYLLQIELRKSSFKIV